MNEFEIIRYPQISGLNLFFDTVDYRTPHVHAEWELILITESALRVICGQKSYLAQPGELILFSPGQPHEFHREGEECTFLCLQISPRGLTESFPDVNRLTVEEPLLRPHLSPEEYAWMTGTMLKLAGIYLRRESCYELECLGLSSLLLHRAFTRMPHRVLTDGEVSSRDKNGARLRRLIRFVDENYMHKIRLSDFAREEDRSVSYLSHFVKATLNQSFQDYVNTVRFNCACQLIASGRQRMLDVCMASGFSDYRYFSRTFRRQLGMTPEEYSRQARQFTRDGGQIRHSLHSLERFYTREQSLALWERFSESNIENSKLV